MLRGVPELPSNGARSWAGPPIAGAAGSGLADLLPAGFSDEKMNRLRI